MSIKKTNLVTSIGGVMAAVGGGLVGAPLVIQQAYAQIVKTGPPVWFNESIVPVMALGVVLGIVGKALLGMSKGQDEHSTVPQVDAATSQKSANEMAKEADELPQSPTPVTLVPTPKEVDKGHS